MSEKCGNPHKISASMEGKVVYLWSNWVGGGEIEDVPLSWGLERNVYKF